MTSPRQNVSDVLWLVKIPRGKNYFSNRKGSKMTNFICTDLSPKVTEYLLPDCNRVSKNQLTVNYYF